MKGVILAGGLGTRMLPSTRVTNKHLLPVYDRPMIYYPIQTLVEAGIDEILLVTGGHHAGDFLQLLGNGRSLGIRELHYTYQEGEAGIADALRLAEDFADGGKVCVILGDNILEKGIRAPAESFARQTAGARILLKEVPDAHRFGVVELDGTRIVRIIEKPKQPPTDLAVTGVYFYDALVFDFIRTLKPSGRGEFEITDVNNAYLAAGLLEYDILDGWWTDAGTFESLYRAATLVREKGRSHGA
ncbi:MAG: NTP transferase domain-containing protein [Phycisphaerae bacterium]